MARKLTPKQEKFATLYVELGNASEAYRQAYDCERMKSETVNRKASEQLDHGMISARIEEIRDQAQERSERTIDSQLDRLDIIFDNHNANPKGAGAAVSAIKEQNDLLGFRVSRHKVEANVVVQELPPLSAKAALALKAKLEAERF